MGKVGWDPTARPFCFPRQTIKSVVLCPLFEEDKKDRSPTSSQLTMRKGGLMGILEGREGVQKGRGKDPRSYGSHHISGEAPC
ncbi:hypothetical protein CDAR_71661 [Caerostris darwini]|uniref:Uncharacterized protein n=1 Tax=Caerostris darwini TaxID=1538125 RepID=A0AAV4NKA3_9ARAC|nr:hypothetical protein CDAR_71661 [Caerostris darwini]